MAVTVTSSESELFAIRRTFPGRRPAYHYHLHLHLHLHLLRRPSNAVGDCVRRKPKPKPGKLSQG